VDPAGRRPDTLRGGAVPLDEAVRDLLCPHYCSFVRCCANVHAPATIASRSVRAGVQPSPERAVAAEATRTAGSSGRPGRGGRGLRDRVAGDAAGALDHLADGEAVAVAEVADEVFAGGGGVQGEQVGLGQVGDVDVVADAGAVGGGVVVAVDGDGRAAALGDLEDEGDEVGLGLVRCAVGAVGAGDVEVAQGGRAQAVGGGLAGDHVVDGQLGGAVGVGGAGGRRLGDGDLVGFAVGGGRGGEDEAAHACLAQGAEQGHGAADVVVPVLLGPGDRLADLGERGEVQDGVVGGVEPLGGVADVALDEPGPGGDG